MYFSIIRCADRLPRRVYVRSRGGYNTVQWEPHVLVAFRLSSSEVRDCDQKSTGLKNGQKCAKMKGVYVRLIVSTTRRHSVMPYCTVSYAVHFYGVHESSPRRKNISPNRLCRATRAYINHVDSKPRHATYVSHKRAEATYMPNRPHVPVPARTLALCNRSIRRNPPYVVCDFHYPNITTTRDMGHERNRDHYLSDTSRSLNRETTSVGRNLSSN